MVRLLLVLSLLSLFAPAGCSRGEIDRVEWTAMGTVAAVQVRGEGGDRGRIDEPATRAKASFAAVEKCLNRFAPDSELNRLAPLPDLEILARCSPPVSNCYATAFRLAQESGGAFNPRWRGPKTMDLGAIAKGFAVDVAAEGLGSDGPDVLLDLGGNLKSVRGAWKVGIAGSDESVELREGAACATSGEYFRGKHIRDGRTGCAVSNGVYSVTVVHPTSAMLADGLSTTLFVLGREEGAKFLRKFHPEAKAVWMMKNDE